MRSRARCTIVALVLVFGLTGASAAWADPPGGFKSDKGPGAAGEHGHGPPRGAGPAKGFRFQDKDRVAVRGYYADLERRGRCPPGLAKKHNGCVPPGQAKRWRIGAPLPRDVVYYSLTPALVVQLTPPPAGYRYVRVASDILMIAAGTGMVAAAIEDLGR